MWQLFQSFGVATIATLLGSITATALVIVLRRQQVQLFRLGYYKRKTGVLKPVDWRQSVGILCLCSVILGFWYPTIGLLSLGIGLAGFLVAVRFARYVEGLQQSEALIAYFTGLEGLIQGGVSFPVALQSLSQGTTQTQTRVRRALKRFSSGSTFGGILNSFTDYAQVTEQAYRLGLPMLPILSGLRQSMEARTHELKRIFQIRSQAATNGLIAFLLPWVLFVVLALQQSEFLEKLLHSSAFGVCAASALLLQITGLAVILKTSAYSPDSSKHLLDFIHALRLYVRSGFSLHWPWHSLCQKGNPGWESFRPNPTESMEGCLLRLSLNYDPERQRFWFQTLRQLYAEGSNLVPLLESMATTLEREEERRLQGFLERLPVRVNVLGILFLFPAFFLLTILPLVIEITGNF